VFDHVTIRVADRAESERFYDAVLATLGIPKTSGGEFSPEWGDFSIARGDAPTRKLHIGFAAPDRAAVDAFHDAGVRDGAPSDGEPGPRPQYRHDYYGGFLLDPDGNSAEGVHHGGMRGDGVDHLWIRVADVAAARDFYAAIAPYSGFTLVNDQPNRLHFNGAKSSFTLIEGPPTENAHIAFAAGDDATVDAFHAAATRAGYRDNGEPGERAVQHPGYYGAYVLDPEGNNVELVSHNRG
jgi:catechol 2,3-dioxygenase-like lactoylglutathione lyase family enzyme